MADMEYEPDESVTDSALHPDEKKQNDIWVNIGAKDGSMACLVIPVTGPRHEIYFAGFNIDTDEEIDEVISMLEEAKGLIAEYKKEFWVELGLPASDTNDDS